MGLNEEVVPMEVVLEMIDGLCDVCKRQTLTRLKLTGTDTGRRDRMEVILQEEARRAGFTPAEVLEKDNRRELVEIRRRVAVRARRFGYSLPQIGNVLKRHHTSVLSLLKGESDAD